MTEAWEVNLVQGRGSLGTYPWELSLAPALSSVFLFICDEESSSVSLHGPCHNVPAPHRPRCNEPSDWEKKLKQIFPH